MNDQPDKKRKPYERPTVKKLTTEEANSLLRNHAENGPDEGTKDQPQTTGRK